MIVLNTNVVSEATKPEAHPNVRLWLDNQFIETLYLSSVTLAKLFAGIAILPTGKGKNALIETVNDFIALLKDRVLPFDNDAAHSYAKLALKARNSGRGFPTPDSYIAAIAASRGFIVASRDRAPYQAAGVAVIDPWKAL